jgi:hypothetical protein
MLESSKHSFTPIKTVSIFNHRISKTHFCELLVLVSLICLGCLGFFCIHKGVQQSQNHSSTHLTLQKHQDVNISVALMTH